jgi:SAM-dependent methyltransferase
MFDEWMAALEQRHLADLRVAEVTRALRALSVDYVHRRERVAHDALAGRGKRAAFALFYGPLHFLVVRDIARQLPLDNAALERITDLGCGTGAAGAAIGSVIPSRPFVVGIDRQGWTLEEAAFTYRHFGLRHRVLRGDARRLDLRRPTPSLMVAAYTINELDDAARAGLLESLRGALHKGLALLVVEPIARSVTPWWNEWRSALAPLGARDDDWRLTDPLPEPLRRWDRAAGLDHRERKARSLWIAPRSRS